MSNTLPTIVIGYSLSHEKFSSLNFDKFLELCQKSNIKTVEIDEKYLENEINGHEHEEVNIIIHKLTDVLSQDLAHNDQNARQFLEKFSQMIARRQHASSSPVIMIDNFELVKCILTRHTQYTLLNDLSTCHVPPFVTIMDESIYKDYEKIQKLLDDKSITYPIICKPLRAHGKHEQKNKIVLIFIEGSHRKYFLLGHGSHNMKVIFDNNHLCDITFPCVLQKFIDHDGILIKAYLLGEIHDDDNNNFRIVYRSSVKNLAGLKSNKTISFTTKEVSKKTIDNENNIGHDHFEIDEIKIKNISNSIQKKLKLNLLGIDVIFDCQTQQYAVIDVNYFPGYDLLKDVHEQLLHLCVKLYEQNNINDTNVHHISNPI